MEDDETRSTRSSQIWSGLLLMGLGGLFGSMIGGDWKEDAAIKWALETTRECERIYRAEDFSSVSACVEQSVDQMRDERKAEARADASDPR